MSVGSPIEEDKVRAGGGYVSGRNPVEGIWTHALRMVSLHPVTFGDSSMLSMLPWSGPRPYWIRASE